MKKLFYLSILIILFSCSEKAEVVRGKLEDFISGEVIFERDEKTGYMGFREPIQIDGKEVVYTEWNGIFQFFDPQTGSRLTKFQLPKEGPNSLKGGYHGGKAFDGLILIAANNIGNVNFYQSDSLFRTLKLDMDSYVSKGYLELPDTDNRLHILSENEFEITFDPFEIMSFRTNEDGLDLEFGSWIGKFDSLGNWLCKSDFKAPYDETYANSISSGKLLRLLENGNSWSMFPFSDSLYLIKDCRIIDRKKLDGLTPKTYFPELFIENGNSGSWEKPDNGAMNRYLLYDSKTDLRLRVTFINQIRTKPEIKDIRQRMYLNETTYLLSIYDEVWNLKAELEFTYPVGSRLENFFSSSGYIYLNKPDQKSEDEYEFYKIDLSQFKD